MTVLSPCRRCARKDTCERLADLREKLRGAGITKGNVRCGIPKVDFPVGQPVAVRTFTMEAADKFDPERPEDQQVAVSRIGVVQRHRAGRFLVLLNVGQEVGHEDRPISIIGVHHDQLSLVDGREVPVDLCPCGLTEDRCEDKALRPQLRAGPWQCWQERLA